MGFWKKFWVGTKIALGIALKLEEAKVIKVKEIAPGSPGAAIIKGITNGQ